MPPPALPPHASGSQSREPALPASLAAARPGSRSGITGTPTDPRFANYEEIQRHLNRRQAQYHSQRREHPNRSDRPVSNFYEYESVQSAMLAGRQASGLPGYQHHVPGSRGHQQHLPTRTEFSPPRNSGRRTHQHRPYPSEGPPLSVAPLHKYDFGQGRGDYEDYRGQPQPLAHNGEVEDPYARVLYRNSRMPNSQSGSRLHHQVPNKANYVTALPPGSKV
jgi:hypothetical protein